MGLTPAFAVSCVYRIVNVFVVVPIVFSKSVASRFVIPTSSLKKSMMIGPQSTAVSTVKT